jgi:hypothetical protein
LQITSATVLLRGLGLLSIGQQQVGRMEMSKRTVMWAAVVGLAGVFSWSATSIAAPKPKATAAQNVTYETGAKAVWIRPCQLCALKLKPGMCWKGEPHGQDGSWIPVAVQESRIGGRPQHV